MGQLMQNHKQGIAQTISLMLSFSLLVAKMEVISIVLQYESKVLTSDICFHFAILMQLPIGTSMQACYRSRNLVLFPQPTNSEMQVSNNNCRFWCCAGRTYAMDCYLKLLVRLCHIYDTVGGVKKAKDGASPEQILAETRLQALQRQLVKDLSEVPFCDLLLCGTAVGSKQQSSHMCIA
jgi:hypothetical protein